MRDRPLTRQKKGSVEPNCRVVNALSTATGCVEYRAEGRLWKLFPFFPLLQSITSPH